ncbi:MAG TPA: HPr family phosphocarrier protein [Gemmataceae bacterium]|nr:HPr family phosphocarrier protein [Gemmataceae bacterium]
MNHSAEASNGGPLRRKVTITNAQGLHLRPMQAFVELASRFNSNVRVQRDDREPVDGRSIMSLMLLGAEKGTELIVEVDGPDAPDALAALVDLLANLESRVDVEST